MVWSDGFYFVFLCEKPYVIPLSNVSRKATEPVFYVVKGQKDTGGGVG